MSSTDLPAVPETPTPPPARSLVVRYGFMPMIGEYPYDADERPTCGAKVVLRTRRGTELGEVVTTTCSSFNCSRSITREQMLTYIENSGGADYPFSTDGRVLRIATVEDIQEQNRLNQEKPRYLAACRALIEEMQLPMKLVDAELLLGGEMATFFFLSEHRVDFRTLVKQLAGQFHTRIQMHQVGARDEARLVADYETCGQHCCCRQFLKLLRPVSMGAAKMQKATLDPSKISGRCGRLKCCLRYEEATYEDLRKRLPKVGSRVHIQEGDAMVEETMILTQLVKLRLDDGRVIALTVEELQNRDNPAPAVGMPPQRRSDDAPRPAAARDAGSRDATSRDATSRESRPEAPRRGSARQERERSSSAEQAPARPQSRPQGKKPAEPAPKAEAKPERSRNARRDRSRNALRAGGNASPARPPQSPPSNGPQVPPAASQPVQPQASRPASSTPSQSATPNDKPTAQPGMGMLGRRRRRGRSRGRDGHDGSASTPPTNPPST